MKEVNFPVGGGSSAYTYSYRDCTGSPTTAFEFADPSVSSWLSLAQTTNSLTITASAAPASLINPRIARVNIKVNGSTCSEYFSVTQAGNVCSCTTAMTTGASTVAIPQIGGSNIEIGTYTADTNCITVSGTGSSNQTWLTNVTVSGGKVKGTLTENVNNSSRSATVTIGGTMKNDSSSCTKTLTVTQPGLSCDCTTAFVATPGTVTQAGSAGASVQIGTYTSDSTCVQTVSGSGVSSESWITTITLSGGKVNGIVAANTGTASRSTTITTKATLKNGTECPKTFILTQQGVACSCGSIVLDEVDPIPQSGLTGGETVGKYKCGTSTCNWCDNWECVINDGASTYNCIVTVNNSTSFTISLASGVVIPENNDPQGNAKTMSLTIKNGGSTCLTDTLTQNGLANCTCEGLIDQTGSMVRTVTTTYDTTGGDGIFASGDTKGCGKLSGFTISTDFIQPGTFAEINPYINNDPNTYAWSGTVTSYAGTRTADINYKYQDRRGEWLECTEYVQLIQGDGVCACPRTSGSIPAATTLADGFGGTTVLGTISGQLKSSRDEYYYYYYFCQAVVAIQELEDGTSPWLSVSSIYQGVNEGGRTDITIRTSPNKTDSPRTATLKIVTLSNPNTYMGLSSTSDRFYNWRNGNAYPSEIEQWAYDTCNEYTVTVTQPVRICNCEKAKLVDSQGVEIEEFGMEVSGGTEPLTVYLPCGTVKNFNFVEHDDHTQLAPYDVIHGNYSEATYVQDNYDSYGDFEIWMSENTTDYSRYYDLEVEIELDNGTTCKKYIEIYQSMCTCEDYYLIGSDEYRKTINIEVPNYPPSSHTYFEVACLPENHELSYTVSAYTNPCDWITEVRVDNVPGNRKKFDIVVVATENVLPSDRTCSSTYGYIIVANIDGQPCDQYSYTNLNITQKGTPQDCDDCVEKLEKFLVTSHTFDYDYHTNGAYDYMFDGHKMKNTYDIQAGTSCVPNYVWTNYQLALDGTNADKFYVHWNPTAYSISVCCLEDNTTSSDWEADIVVKGCKWDAPTNCMDYVPNPGSPSYKLVCTQRLKIRQEHAETPPPPTTYSCDDPEGRCNCVSNQGKYMPAFGTNTSNEIVMINGSLVNGKWEMNLSPNLTDQIIGSIPMDYFECITNYCVDENDNPDCSCLGYNVNNASQDHLQLWIDTSGNIHAKTGNVGSGITYSSTITYWYNGDSGTSVQCTLNNEARIINVTF